MSPENVLGVVIEIFSAFLLGHFIRTSEKLYMISGQSKKTHDIGTQLFLPKLTELFMAKCVFSVTHHIKTCQLDHQ